MKRLFVFISGLFAYLSLPLIVFAQTPTQTSVNPCAEGVSGIAKTLCGLGGEGGTGGGNISTTIQNIVVFFVIIAIVAALLYLLYGGVKWIISRGEKTAIEEARNHIMAAIIGLIVVILAVFILSIILAAFGIGFGNLAIPVITSVPTPTE